jgi:hypothetical protein
MLLKFTSFLLVPFLISDTTIGVPKGYISAAVARLNLC